jgi:signal peptidase II
VIVFILDRVTKALIVANVPEHTEVAAIPRLVWITHVQNAGAAFGIAPMGSAFFLLASVAVAAGLVVYVVRTPSPARVDALLGLILGGTLGNGYDRLVHGTVTDFIALHFWPVFNVADSAISVGVVLLLAGYLLRRRPSA